MWFDKAKHIVKNVWDGKNNNNNRQNRKKSIIKITLSIEYADFVDIFSKQNTDILPKYSMHNLAIKTEKRKQLFFGFVYNYSAIKLQTFHE